MPKQATTVLSKRADVKQPSASARSDDSPRAYREVEPNTEVRPLISTAVEFANNSILITGGAGYIGSHAALAYQEQQENVVIVDNLSTGFAKTVLNGTLINGSIGDVALIKDTIKKYAIDSVIHFAAHTSVAEAISNPLKYYHNNVGNMCQLLMACLESGVKHFIFSSSAAVYGIPTIEKVGERHPCKPINPYGHSKLMGERLLQDAANQYPFNYVCLRYFNVAGADPANRLGRLNAEAPGLIKIVAETAVGKREYIDVYGNNYATPDGTGVRDYIHVTDLVTAHIHALNYLRKGGKSTILNCGYGHGYSVKQIISSTEKIIGKPLPTRICPARLGDPACVIADNQKIRKLLAWQPNYDNLELILKTALCSEQTHFN